MQTSVYAPLPTCNSKRILFFYKASFNLVFILSLSMAATSSEGVIIVCSMFFSFIFLRAKGQYKKHGGLNEVNITLWPSQATMSSVVWDDVAAHERNILHFSSYGRNESMCRY